ncbi:hypothetical protein J2T17_002771 [Paenibacillus mucilaginosus]
MCVGVNLEDKVKRECSECIPNAAEYVGTCGLREKEGFSFSTDART